MPSLMRKSGLVCAWRIVWLQSEGNSLAKQSEITTENNFWKLSNWEGSKWNNSVIGGNEPWLQLPMGIANGDVALKEKSFYVTGKQSIPWDASYMQNTTRHEINKYRNMTIHLAVTPTGISNKSRHPHRQTSRQRPFIFLSWDNHFQIEAPKDSWLIICRQDSFFAEPSRYEMFPKEKKVVTLMTRHDPLISTGLIKHRSQNSNIPNLQTLCPHGGFSK